MSGWRLVASADDGEAFLIGRVIQGRAELGEMATWLQAHAQTVPAPRARR